MLTSFHSSFHSDIRGSFQNIQVVVHSSMWEYGGDDQNLDREQGDTSSVHLEPHLSDFYEDDSSIDGVIDLATSFSETTLRRERVSTSRNQATSEVDIPELYNMNDISELNQKPSSKVRRRKYNPKDSL